MTDDKKPTGYNGRILKVDLTRGEMNVEEPDEGFYRTYLGGGLLGTYYVFRETKPGVDALAPDNVLVFAPSVVSGAPVMGASRFNVTAKSPLTGAIGDTQCGGNWGAKLKHSGFDAVVIKGKSPRPVYLWIDQGKAEIRNAAHLWGKTTGEAQALIHQELGDKTIEVAQIGPAGENLVRFACVTGGLSHFAGRTGMGAVMGAKNLKAVAVRGKRPYTFSDEQAVKALARKGVNGFKASEGLQAFHEHGTSIVVMSNRDKGNVVTHNFQAGDFEGLEGITGQRMTETILKGTGTCWGCPIACKREVELDAPYHIDPRYGGPEFEAVIMLGSNLGIGNLPAVAKASELCNKYTMDCISAGGVIAFAMECFERGILNKEDTSGLELRFGNEEATLRMLEMIAFRQGIGNVLAEGPERAARIFGKGSEAFAVHTKNQAFPAHMPRVKPGQALIYAINPYGADHMSSEHDWIAVFDSDISRGLGITEFTEMDSLDRTKTKATMLSQFYYSLMDTLTVCHFPWGPGAVYSYDDLVELVRCVTGWSVNFWELMRAGERRVQLMKAFNTREGVSPERDVLPRRMYEPIKGGVGDGRRIDPKQFEQARAAYYEMMNWDPQSGQVLPGRLLELGLDWVEEAKNHQ